MSLLKQLTRWKIRGQIDQDVIDIILTLQSRLEHHWRIDVSIPTVITLLLLKTRRLRFPTSSTFL